MSIAVGFGVGDVFFTPYGSAIAPNPTAMKAAILQECTVETSSNLKDLFGKNSFAVAVRRGQQKISIKAKTASITAKFYNDILWGQTITSAQQLAIVDEPQTPMTHVATVTNSGTWSSDLGVVDTVTGLSLINVGAGSITMNNQYKVAAGVYTFNTAFADPVLISYLYTSSAGQAFTLPNLPIGATPLVQICFTTTDAPTGNQVTLRFRSCVVSKFSFGTKLEDFTMPDFEAEAYADTSGSVFDWWSSN